MSGIVGAVMERQDRPAFVRFQRRSVDDKPASLAAGHYVARDLDFALITPLYSKDVIEMEVATWFLNMENDLRNDRIPPSWVDAYRKAYAAWQNGQELPPTGTAIRGWGVISPAQQETLIRMSILTVEDLAGINDEGIRRLGMGGNDLKNKAAGWLKQLTDKGPLTQEIAAVKAENALLKTSTDTLEAQVKALTAQVRAMMAAVPAVQQAVPQTTISADDILPEVDEPKPRKK